VEHAANAWAAAHPFWSVLASDLYQYAHIPVTLGVLTICWWCRPELYRRARTALVGVNAMGLLVFLLLPVAPPRLLPGHGFVDIVALAGFGTDHGWPLPADQYGALPSLHLAWAVWATVVAGRMLGSPRARRLLWGYPLLVTAGVVLTGNHYLLDAAAGTAVALLSLWLVQWLSSGRAARPSTLLPSLHPRWLGTRSRVPAVGRPAPVARTCGP